MLCRICDVEKIYKIDLDNISIGVKSFIGVIMTYADLPLIKTLCHQISTEIRKRENVKYHFVLIPHVTSAIEILLEEEGLYGMVALHSFLWQPIVIDSNIISLELPDIFSSLFLKKNLLITAALTKSLEHMFALFGEPRNSFIHGDISLDVYGSLNPSCFKQSSISDIDYFIMFDRSVDYASVLLTPTTYIGLLDFVFNGINKEVLEINENTIINKRKDVLLKDLKYKNIMDVSNFLKEKSRFLQNEHNKYQNNMSVPELKQYINQDLKGIIELKRNVDCHITACFEIVKTMGESYAEISELENSIINNIDRGQCYEVISNMLLGSKIKDQQVLQLICLLSYHNQGMQADQYDEFKRNYFHLSGYNHLTTFYNLEKIKLLTKKNTLNISDTINAQTQMVNNELRSIISKLKSPSEVPSSPNSLNRYYVSRIIELIVSHKYSVDNLCKLFTSQCHSSINNNTTSKDKVTFFLCVVGGITHNEIASLTELEESLGINIVVHATNLISGDSMMQQCMAS